MLCFCLRVQFGGISEAILNGTFCEVLSNSRVFVLLGNDVRDRSIVQINSDDSCDVTNVQDFGAKSATFVLQVKEKRFFLFILVK